MANRIFGEGVRPDLFQCWACSGVFISIIKCRQCELAIYCSPRCRETHWNNGHEDQCRDLADKKNRFEQEQATVNTVSSAGAIRGGDVKRSLDAPGTGDSCDGLKSAGKKETATAQGRRTPAPDVDRAINVGPSIVRSSFLSEDGASGQSITSPTRNDPDVFAEMRASAINEKVSEDPVSPSNELLARNKRVAFTPKKYTRESETTQAPNVDENRIIKEEELGEAAVLKPAPAETTAQAKTAASPPRTDNSVSEVDRAPANVDEDHVMDDDDDEVVFVRVCPADSTKIVVQGEKSAIPPRKESVVSEGSHAPNLGKKHIVDVEDLPSSSTRDVDRAKGVLQGTSTNKKAEAEATRSSWNSKESKDDNECKGDEDCVEKGEKLSSQSSGAMSLVGSDASGPTRGSNQQELPAQSPKNNSGMVARPRRCRVLGERKTTDSRLAELAWWKAVSVMRFARLDIDWIKEKLSESEYWKNR
mmetsp:Transcript_44276/g.65692  ORF Transcript_44276/g.65692 Transcript_44276/m.65692 type:complete len:475 (+) Transcript_44276:207-1631(+)